MTIPASAARTRACSGSHTTPSARVPLGTGTSTTASTKAAVTPRVVSTERARLRSRRGLESTKWMPFARGQSIWVLTAQAASSTPMTKNCPAMKSTITARMNMR